MYDFFICVMLHLFQNKLLPLFCFLYEETVQLLLKETEQIGGTEEAYLPAFNCFIFARGN